MKKENLVPKDVKEDEYFSVSLVAKIFEVTVRQTRNIADSENMEKAYYSKLNKTDLACYLSRDVHRVAMARKNRWPDLSEYREDIVHSSEVYDSLKRVMFNKSQKQVEEVITQMQTPATAEAPKPEAQMVNVIPHEEYLALFVELVDEVKRMNRGGGNASNRRFRLFQYGALIMIFSVLIYCVHLASNL